MGRCVGSFRRKFLAGGNDDGLGHALVEGKDFVSHFALGAGVVKNADDGGIATLEDAGDAAETAAIGAGRSKFHEDLVALHGAVDFVGRDEDVFLFTGALAGVGADEAVAIAVEVHAAGDEIVAG